MTTRPRDLDKRPKPPRDEDRAEDDEANGEADEADERAADARDDEDNPSEKAPYRGSKPGGKKASKADPPTIWQRATLRWTAITTVMAALLILYTQHPYYQGAQFAPWRPLFVTAFCLWLAVGLFYCKATLEKFKGTRYVVRDGGLHLLMLARASFQDVLSRVEWVLVALFSLSGLALGIARTVINERSSWPWRRLDPIVHHDYAGVALFGCFVIAAAILARGMRPGRVARLAKNPRVRTTLLGIGVKGFFTPLMTGFLSGHLNSVSRSWLHHKHLPPLEFKAARGMDTLAQIKGWWAAVGSRLPELVPSGHDLASFFTPWTWTRAEFSWGLGIAYDTIFIVDCGFALVGYASESRWIGNKTRSVEPTAFGWAVCIFCYPPFNNILGTYLPLANGEARITSDNWLLAFRAATVVLFAIYSAATVAFGFKFSNLTNRGIVMRGPYRFVRHPAYLCKCSAWWLEHIPTMTLVKALFLTLLCGVYALRAWTEERHLSKDPDYVAYKKKTPWVLLPGVY